MKLATSIFHLWVLIAIGIIPEGCSSSSSNSSSPSLVPMAVPPVEAAAVGSPAPVDTTYQGILVHPQPGLGPTMGWRIRNENIPGSVPVDVTKVQAVARTLVNKMVLLKGHSVSEAGGRTVIAADSVTEYVAASN
jgi:hypothetical protein